MERTGLLKEGDVLPVTEYQLPNSYYYVLGRSYAMSENVSKAFRLSSTEGVVVEIKETPRGYYVAMEFDEDEVAK